MSIARGERKCRSPSTEIDWRGVLHSRARTITNGDNRVLTKLAILVRTPANDRRVVEQRTGVTCTSHDASRATPGRELDGKQIRAHFIWPVTAIHGVAVTKLTHVVLAPALDVVIVEQRTRVRRAGGDLGRSPPSS